MRGAIVEPERAVGIVEGENCDTLQLRTSTPPWSTWNMLWSPAMTT